MFPNLQNRVDDPDRSIVKRDGNIEKYLCMRPRSVYNTSYVLSLDEKCLGRNDQHIGFPGSKASNREFKRSQFQKLVLPTSNNLTTDCDHKPTELIPCIDLSSILTVYA